MNEEILALGRQPVARSRDIGLEAVFRLSYRKLVVQMYGVTGDATEAEDLVQEAFVRAAASGRRFAAVDNPEAWLRTTAVNLYRNRWRRLRNFSRIRYRLENPVDLPGLDDHVAVVRALRALPEGQREAIVLHHLCDLSVAEVADLLGCAQGTVKSRLKRGRDALAGQLGPWEGARDD